MRFHTNTYPPHLVILNIVVTSISLFSSFAMAIFCLKAPMKSTVCLRLILGIALSDFFYSISNVLSFFDDSSEAICAIESIVRLCSYQFSLVFATSIALLCYKASSPQIEFDQGHFFKSATSFCLTTLIILTSLPFIFPDKIIFSHESLLCTITSDPHHNSPAERIIFLTMYQGLISFAGVLITCCAYIKTVKRLRRLEKEMHGLLDINLKRLFWYPAIMSIIYIPSIIERYWSIYVSAPNWLTIVHFGLTHSVGFLNFLVYGWQRKLYYSGKQEGRQSSQKVEYQSPQDDNSFSLDEELLQKKRLNIHQRPESCRLDLD